ncbi:uncharacterized protein PHALS_05546 [Plasmopara halstedii]|uniref:Uncharacterized protein n=1 Tax=Plasmopara halstedii TaxID=4781 RepID=A0A0P1B016_PLAHL|nr:uncharacterized protein PHALS_05546 [Plasmopara halstedii]CEG48070.1 hypothetical protein PHALS_05546 [Plasmopara halstedii]|eukprot:XP_024584439.1 hypothetical protein PHALS_05546 [Plasmopara halstedii]
MLSPNPITKWSPAPAIRPSSSMRGLLGDEGQKDLSICNSYFCYPKSMILLCSRCPRLFADGTPFSCSLPVISLYGILNTPDRLPTDRHQPHASLSLRRALKLAASTCQSWGKIDDGEALILHCPSKS